MKVYNSNQKLNPIDKSESLKIDYKNIQLLQKYISETGKILPRRVTFASAKNQRRLAKAIKTARTMALIPYKTD